MICPYDNNKQASFILIHLMIQNKRIIISLKKVFQLLFCHIRVSKVKT